MPHQRTAISISLIPMETKMLFIMTIPLRLIIPAVFLCVSAIDCTDVFMKSPEVLMAVFWLLSGCLFFLEPNVNIFGQ